MSNNGVEWRTGACDDVKGDVDGYRDRTVRLIQRLTSRGVWAIPAEQYAKIPAGIVQYLDSLDPVRDSRNYERAVRLLAHLHQQNLVRDRQEIQYLRPGAPGAPPEESPPEALEAPVQPQIAHLERPGLRDAAETARILEELGILQDVAEGSAELDSTVIDAESSPHQD